MPETRNVCDYCGEVIVHSCPPQPNSFVEINKRLREIEEGLKRALRGLEERIDNLRVCDE